VVLYVIVSDRFMILNRRNMPSNVQYVRRDAYLLDVAFIVALLRRTFTVLGKHGFYRIRFRIPFRNAHSGCIKGNGFAAHHCWMQMLSNTMETVWLHMPSLSLRVLVPLLKFAHTAVAFPKTKDSLDITKRALCYAFSTGPWDLGHTHTQAVPGSVVTSFEAFNMLWKLPEGCYQKQIL
jgi:hypothetical protein